MIADFAATSAYFHWAGFAFLATLVLLSWLARPCIGRLIGRRDLLFSLLVLTNALVIASGLIWVGPRTLAVGLAASVVLLLVAGTRWSKPAALARQRNLAWESRADRRARWLLQLALGLLTTWLLADGTPHVHYDYFHGSLPAVDLAVHGRSPSAWLSQFDPSPWFLVVQSTLPVLDAIGAVLTGHLTTALPLLYCWLAVALFIDATPGWFAKTLAGALAAVFLVDFHFAPRPHVLVGLFTALVVLGLGRGATAFELAIYVLSLALAKRDGLVLSLPLALSLAAIAAWNWLGRRAGIALAGVGLAATAVILNSWPAIRGQTPAHVLSEAAANVPWAALAANAEVRLTLVMLAVTLLSLVLSRCARTVVFVTVGMCLYVIVSALALLALDQYNRDTVLRKIFYMLVPVLAAALSLAARARRPAAVSS